MKRLRSFIRVFLVWTAVGVMGKVLFLAMHHGLYADAGMGQMLMAVVHGLRLDVAIAGYLTIVPSLLLMLSLWRQSRWLSWLWNTYFALTATVAALAYVANIGLYGYWGFPLDNTPLLYVRTSPADALASMTLWQLLLAPVAIAVVAWAIYRLMPHPLEMPRVAPLWARMARTVGMLLLTAALILPIRGGVGTGTNHTGSVYFSQNMRLNHAAVNPIFCFIESALHQEEIGTRYRFMSDDEATRLMQGLCYTKLRYDSAATARQPLNVVLVTLESFSDTVMRVPGITPCLDSIVAKGISFSRFYANSFRTDRALVAIHSALPAQPTMSIMDMPHKSTTLPSIAGTLGSHGYETSFYYGGDIDYSNMRSYFVGTGFQRIVADTDFPRHQRTGKWGVADGPLFDRVLRDISTGQTGRPFFVSIMTGSSHEPFDVPAFNRIKDDAALNAFAYADSCLGRFIGQMRSLPCWPNTLVVIVADHLGVFPSQIDNYQLWRYRVPLVLTGGAVSAPAVVSTIGSQVDIAATLLGLMGIDHSQFTYSKDLLDPQAPHFAVYTFPDAIGMVADGGSVLWDNTLGRVHSASGVGADSLAMASKAYLQRLYDDIDAR